MDLDPRRKPAYDLFESVVSKLVQAHCDVVQEVVAAFPEIKEDLEWHNQEYCKRLKGRLAQCQHYALNEDNEPLRLLLTTLNAQLDFDNSGANVAMYDQVQRRLGIPTPDREKPLNT